MENAAIWILIQQIGHSLEKSSLHPSPCMSTYILGLLIRYLHLSPIIRAQNMDASLYLYVWYGINKVFLPGDLSP